MIRIEYVGVSLERKNADELINEKLNIVQTRAIERLLTATDLRTAAREAEKRLTAAGVPKRLWEGVGVLYDPYRIPAAYGWKAAATRAMLTYHGRRWRVTGVERGPCLTARNGIPSEHSALKITVPPAPDLLKAMMRTHGFELG